MLILITGSPVNTAKKEHIIQTTFLSQAIFFKIDENHQKTYIAFWKQKHCIVGQKLISSYFLSNVIPGQSSVRNGEAGRPSSL
jgi:hypothetical protein